MANNLSANLSLQSPIYEAIDPADKINVLLAHNANMSILEKACAGAQSAATTGVNATQINTGGNRTVLLQSLSAGSISSITGMITGMPFTLVFQSSGSTAMIDVGTFKLNGNLTPGVNTSITLVFDGTNYVELARSVNG